MKTIMKFLKLILCIGIIGGLLYLATLPAYNIKEIEGPSLYTLTFGGKYVLADTIIGEIATEVKLNPTLLITFVLYILGSLSMLASVVISPRNKRIANLLATLLFLASGIMYFMALNFMDIQEDFKTIVTLATGPMVIGGLAISGAVISMISLFVEPSK